MKTVILAAGIASRLRPLTDNTPKCLLKIGGKSILEMTIENILETNNTEIIIVTGYRENMIREFVSKRFPDLNVTYVYNNLYTSTNNIYSLWLTKELVLSGDNMMMMDSDIIFDKSIITKLTRSGHRNCLALVRHELHDEEIKVKTDSKGRVIAISKDVDPAEAAGESIGIEIFGGETLDKLFEIMERKIVIEKKVNVFYEAAFQELSDLYTVDTTELFCMEIDTAEDLAAAEELILKQFSEK
jgi:choline kinase